MRHRRIGRAGLYAAMVDTALTPDAATRPRHGRATKRPRSGWRPGPLWLAAAMVAAQFVAGRWDALADSSVRLWSTLFVSICVQALPFLVLGVTISGLLEAFVPADAVRRLLPKRPALAVPVAGLAGFALPGCECGSVPVAGRLIAGGAPPAAALTFLLAAPAINPVVIVSTAVAFPGQPAMVVARVAASLTAAMVMGLLWSRAKVQDLFNDVHTEHSERPGRVGRFAEAASRDLVHAGGYLVVGAFAAATLQLVIPRTVLDAVAGNELLAIATLAVAAVVLSICSEADAFVAAGLPQFSLSSRLVFLVVGPMVDLKLIALQNGVLGRRVAVRFAPVTLVVAVASATAFGMLLR